MAHLPPRWTTELSTLSTFSEASLTATPTNPISSLSFTSYPSETGVFTSGFPPASSDIPSGTTGILSGSISASAPGSFTTAFPTTLTFPSTTLVTTAFTEIPNSAPTASNSNVDPVCAGQSVDAAATGVIASLIFTAAVGFLIWLLFALLRPRIRALYAAREWFLRPDLRPAPLRSTLWAFLFPPVPLVPALASQAPFPSDGELAQRTLWVAFLLVLGWTIVGLVGALPLYLVGTPCLANSYPHAIFGGRVSTLQDLSLLRLLKMYDEGDITTTSTSTSFTRRAFVDGSDRTPAARTRLIILTVLLLALFALPALFKLLHEWTKLLANRQRWLDDLGGVDVVWLRSDRAPGFEGWGEGRVKDLFVRCGLTSKMGGPQRRATGASTSGHLRSLGGSGSGDGSRRTHDTERGNGNGNGNGNGSGSGDVDVHSVFTIVNTSRLEDLIRERATVLENLEVAETHYINSFQLATPGDGSEEETSEGEGRRSGPRISRPRPLGGKRREHISQLGPGEHGGPTPTSYVAPSQYYKLRSVSGLNGGRISSSTDSLAQRISQRVIGSRFQEVTRESISFGRLPLGSKVRVGQTGELAAMPPTPAPGETTFGGFGPNHPPIEEEGWEMTQVPSETDFQRSRGGPSWFSSTAVGTGTGTGTGTAVASKGPSARESVVKPSRKMRDSSDAYGRREPSDGHGRRSTSDGHGRRDTSDGHGKRDPSGRRPSSAGGRRSDERPRRQFVRPISGLDHTGLATVYDGIRTWRSRLKGLNAEIVEAQQEAFTAIAEGRQVKGWLIVGRNVRYLAGAEPIEGRAKADIRWRELQEQGGIWSDVRYWAVVAVTAILLAGSLIPVVGLASAGAPDVVNILPFLKSIANSNNLGAALATTLAPAVAATLFIVIALLVVNRAAKFTGAASVSATRLRAFKATFYVLTFIATAWIIAAGAVIFGLEALDRSQDRTRTIANGSMYIAVLLLVLVLNAAVIAPGLQMLQPLRLWKVHRAQRRAITPRQYFRAIYPKSFNPAFASGCCVLAVIFASTFSLIFPLIGPPILLLVLLSLVAYRYLVGYVWSRTNAPSTGGLLQLWLLRRFATLLALQPLLMGLIFLSRRLWALAGVLFGAALLIIVVVEGYCTWKSRTPRERNFSPVVRDSLATFRRSVRGNRSRRRLALDEDVTSLVSSPAERSGVPRRSIASVLDMMSITLNVMPSLNRERDAVPIETEDIDDMVSTERAAHTHPDAAPMIPSTDPAMETAGLLYPPELLAPPPTIWLPHDRSGIARSEAYDLGRYHDLETLLDPGDGYTHDGSSSGGRRSTTPRH